VQFSRLRLTGFKSFVDPTDLVIEPGLTGVVGPNGCGKSNLVEAVRWVMGESSAKQMRGGAMDDVIFSGTASRPARNIAEVSLTLDNATRDAPAAFNDTSEVEITRRIERESGSIYRINGRDVRARDVQLLFADVATGAQSPALVGQGEIATIVSAKPSERRRLLEEAAGITGLHSRRHEAELRLRGAETNMERVEDVVRTLESQFQGLKRQARQARRYRNLSGHIRRAQALLFHLRWRELERELEAAERRLAEVGTRGAEHTQKAAAATTEQAHVAEGRPDLRQDEAEAAARLHRLELERDGLNAEEARIEERRRDLETRIHQIGDDVGREEALAGDADEAITRLGTEQGALEDVQAGEREIETRAGEALASASAAVIELDEHLTTLTKRVAAEEAERNGLKRRIAELETRSQRIEQRRAETSAQRDGLQTQDHEASWLEEAEASIAVERERRQAARERLDEAQAERVRCQAEEAKARDEWQAAEIKRDRLRAEQVTLASLLGAGDATFGPPVLDQLKVDGGYEPALGAAFGGELAAPTDERAPVHWSVCDAPEGPSLPEGAMPLDRVVKAPAALRRRLSQIGVVEASEGAALRAKLVPGQCLVSRDGAMWRWDGYTVAPDAPASAATHLKQRKRLTEIDDELRVAEAVAERAAATLEATRATVKDASDLEKEAQATFQATDDTLSAAWHAQGDLVAQTATHESQRRALTETLERLEGELDEAAGELAATRMAFEALPDVSQGRSEMENQQLELVERRRALAERQSEHDRLARESQFRRERIAAITREIDGWRSRRAGAMSRLDELKERRDGAQNELERLAERPIEIEAKRRALLETIGDAEAARRQAADALASAEEQLANLERTSREAERTLGGTREERVRAEAGLDQARQLQKNLASQIAERLEAAPEELPALAEHDPSAPVPEEQVIEKRLERLVRERENMGAVNLRAEQEAAELEEQITTLTKERADLEAAIARLRQGIASLNREGRERILAAFAKIDGHFGALFKDLFGGGKAELKLVESDDPLEAGLEIHAAPPGKKLRVLSLLSGGEQTMTGLTLLFAVFLTNPAPICVLDEADAALDDSNVERFCRLVANIADQTATRFMVITHNRITMASVNRLFGVTMGERGISQLVSVDLETAEELRETA
jgi:chromosome segregation protein